MMEVGFHVLNVHFGIYAISQYVKDSVVVDTIQKIDRC